MPIILPTRDEQLLKECDVQCFKSSGPGGQHVNTTDTAVRMTHRPTAIMVTSRSGRSQHQNRQQCLRKIRETVADRNRPRKARVATRMPRAIRRRILESKRRRAVLKSGRRRINDDGREHND